MICLFHIVPSPGNCDTFYWLKAKHAIINLAKSREKELEREEKFRKDLLNGYYSSIMDDLVKGVDCLNELVDIKKQLNEIYQERSKRKVDKMRCLEINTPNYDIHKLQNQRKFESQSSIKEIKILQARIWTGPVFLFI